mgnify:CR=1 FL=1
MLPPVFASSPLFRISALTAIALAANLATEFIEMGCRAVIAAGWAVDDAAAEVFSATFYPITVYPGWVQQIVMALPLWHGVELMRQLSIGVFTDATWVHLAYFVVMSVAGVAFCTLRLRALFLR